MAGNGVHRIELSENFGVGELGEEKYVAETMYLWCFWVFARVSSVGGQKRFGGYV